MQNADHLFCRLNIDSHFLDHKIPLLLHHTKHYTASHHKGCLSQMQPLLPGPKGNSSQLLAKQRPELANLHKRQNNFHRSPCNYSHPFDQGEAGQQKFGNSQHNICILHMFGFSGKLACDRKFRNINLQSIKSL